MRNNKTTHSWKLSRRAAEVGPFLVMEVLERALELEHSGRSVIHLEVGEPDFDTPEPVREAAIRALRDGCTHYTHSLGRVELREALSAWYRARYGIEVSPDRFVVTVGSSSAMLLVFAALIEEGDRVLVPEPGYPCYPKFVRLLGGRPRSLLVDAVTAFQPSPSRLLRAVEQEQPKVVVVNSPSNPAGTLLEEDGRQCLADSMPANTAVVSDEIYHGLVYEGTARCVLEYLPDGVVVSGFSKLFAMTGWRLGWAVLPEPLVRTVRNLQQNLFISASDFAQIAAVAALTQCDEQLEAMRSAYDRRRRLLLRDLEKWGLHPAARPQGAFYVLVDVSPWTRDVLSFVLQLLEDTGVAVTPGTDFGAAGEGFIRLSYAVSEDDLEEGIDRLGRYLAERRDPGFEGGPAKQ